VRSAFPPAAVASFSVDLPSKALSSLTAPSQPSASPDGHTQSAVTSGVTFVISFVEAYAREAGVSHAVEPTITLQSKDAGRGKRKSTR
jgi:hypothetical protein